MARPVLFALLIDAPLHDAPRRRLSQLAPPPPCGGGRPSPRDLCGQPVYYVQEGDYSRKGHAIDRHRRPHGPRYPPHRRRGCRRPRLASRHHQAVHPDREACRRPPPPGPTGARVYPPRRHHTLPPRLTRWQRLGQAQGRAHGSQRRGRHQGRCRRGGEGAALNNVRSDGGRPLWATISGRRQGGPDGRAPTAWDSQGVPTPAPLGTASNASPAYTPWIGGCPWTGKDPQHTDVRMSIRAILSPSPFPCAPLPAATPSSISPLDMVQPTRGAT